MGMDKITSPDGTPIAYYRNGSGPPLILVAGTGAANPLAWIGIIPGLKEHFSVIAVDRRGRRMSGDSPTFVQESTLIIHQALQISRIAELPEQQHIAMYTAAESFLKEVVSFITEPELK